MNNNQNSFIPNISNQNNVNNQNNNGITPFSDLDLNNNQSMSQQQKILNSFGGNNNQVNNTYFNDNSNNIFNNIPSSPVINNQQNNNFVQMQSGVSSDLQNNNQIIHESAVVGNNQVNKFINPVQEKFLNNFKHGNLELQSDNNTNSVNFNTSNNNMFTNSVPNNNTFVNNINVIPSDDSRKINNTIPFGMSTSSMNITVGPHNDAGGINNGVEDEYSFLNNQNPNKFINNSINLESTKISDLGSEPSSYVRDYSNDARVQQNLINNQKEKNTVKITDEMKVFFIIFIVLLVFIFVVPFIFDLINKI